MGIVIVVAGISGVTNTLALLLDLWRRGAHRAPRTLVLLAGNLAAYGAECWWGAVLCLDPTQITALDNTTYALLILFAVGLARAWEVLGGTDYSLVRILRQRLFAAMRQHDDDTPRK